ncbi:MAG TPA: FKBP-type peptidyl-prolyl cis-trans isomerase [Allosphingosinicella sp.]|nr:FKBP-type peptidyl-prolyl cis-trans isomerase [Allosphingosinicella sp.]
MSATAVPIRPIRKGSVLKFWLALLALAFAAAVAAWCGTSSFQYETLASGLQYQVVKPGTGPSPTPSDVALIDYTGKLDDGTIFDTTKGKQPVPMPVSGVIPGFSEGLQLMNRGATYRLRIPPALGYGAQSSGSIPPNATLHFEVTLHEFIPEAQLRAMMRGAGPPPQGQ